MMNHADYRKYNDRSENSSTYHKKDGTPVRGILKREAQREIDSYTRCTCVNCGGTMNGDGYTQAYVCENRELLEDVEADSGPWYCEFIERGTQR